MDLSIGRKGGGKFQMEQRDANIDCKSPFGNILVLKNPCILTNYVLVLAHFVIDICVN